MGVRYYNPVTGRYINRDPKGYKDGLNDYIYVHNNPINHIDPLGLGEGDIEWHHELPQEIFDPKRNPDLFKNNPALSPGMMDEAHNGWIGTRKDHMDLHNAVGIKPESPTLGNGWNKDWAAWAGQQKAGSITPESVETQMQKMNKTYESILSRGISAEGANGGINYKDWSRKDFGNSMDNVAKALGEEAKQVAESSGKSIAGATAEIGGKVLKKLALPLALGFAFLDYTHGSENGGGVGGGMKQAVKGAVGADLVESIWMLPINAAGNAYNEAADTYKRNLEKLADPGE